MFIVRYIVIIVYITENKWQSVQILNLYVICVFIHGLNKCLILKAGILDDNSVWLCPGLKVRVRVRRKVWH